MVTSAVTAEAEAAEAAVETSGVATEVDLEAAAAVDLEAAAGSEAVKQADMEAAEAAVAVLEAAVVISEVVEVR